MKQDKYFIRVRHIHGIYCIYNNVNKKIYIGSTEEIGKRLSIHRSRLRGGYHPNIHLQRAWNKYGETSFTFSVIAIINSAMCLQTEEQRWIDLYSACDPNFGYNIRPLANGGKHSEETKRKISLAKKGVPMKESTKLKLSKAKTGKSINFSSEWLQKVRLNATKRKGTTLSEETKNKISNRKKGCKGWNKGLKLGQDQIEKIRMSRLKFPNPRDPVTGHFLKGVSPKTSLPIR